VFFGFYCLLIGYLIVRSRFLPRILGVFMAIAGLAYQTFLSPPLASYLFPYVVAPAGTLSRQPGQSVDYRRRNHRHRRFADSRRGLSARHDVDINGGLRRDLVLRSAFPVTRRGPIRSTG